MLHDTTLRALKGNGKSYKRADGGGLYIQVDKDGRKFWRLAYRFNGKQKLLSGGAYPAVGLLAAREWRAEAKAQLARGEDPSAVRKEEKRQARMVAGNQFESVALEWYESRKPQWTDRYAALVLSRFKNDVFPEIGHLPIHTIEAPIVLDMVRKIERRGAVEFAHRIRAHCGNVFTYAIAEGRATRDPTKDIVNAQKKPKPVVHRARLKASEMPDFWTKFHADDCEPLTKLALRWTIMTMVRTQETRFAEWKEFEGLDGPEPVWRIGPARMKMNNEHLVPLSKQAVALLDEIRKISGRSRYVFPVPGTKKGVISENRMLDMMYRMGYRGKATVHGFRGLASTVLNEATHLNAAGDELRMFDRDWIERQLAHVEQDEVRAAYNAAEWLGPRRRMLQWWSDWLDAREQRGDEFDSLL